MKFLVLRSDLKRKLKYINLLIIDAEIFAAEIKEAGGLLCEKIEPDNLKSLLEKNMRIVLSSNTLNGGYDNLVNGSDIKYIPLDGLSYKEFIERLCADYGLNNTQVAFINKTEQDNDLLSGLNFSVSTIDAPLELKTASYYVSNFTGTDTLNEILQIINQAKNG